MTSAYILAGVGLFFAGMVQGCTGFGLALVASPTLMLVFPPTYVVPTVILMSTLNTLIVTWDARKHIQFAMLLPLVMGGFLGLPIGQYLLKTLPGEYLKLIVGVIAVGFAATSLAGWHRPIPAQSWFLTPLGIISGVLGASTSMGGPPIALFLANQQIPKNVFRSTLITYFFTVNCVMVAMFSYSGILNRQIFWTSVSLFPLMVAGTLLGIFFARWSSEELFRRLALWVVAMMGTTVLLTNLPKVL
ncbi:MAG TPA: sulfite exporter TauE/SafE family protein [Candidatus Hydrogenedentes bacterium]|nr:sulfite exporter TauE/SafE family protein [Candidatus Hydrogenedentota bacterium]HOL78022.1 sulfite exporter TauE/SafE family protein [Candidatus Hydrogenedentota bacterium]HPO84619.1 sulfite exporter TauE/SafE family protein [Candidatus Hydrogenedentota bacterium]